MGILDTKENAAIAKKLGNMASALISTVAKLYIASPNSKQWTETGVWGACSLVVDRSPPKSLLIQIYDLKTFDLKFSTEVYEGMQYSILHNQFHTFETERSVIGLNFTDVTEATNFAVKVKALTPAMGSTKTIPSNSQKKEGFWSRMKHKVAGISTTKAEISGPTNVKRGAHIGYDPDKGFECSDIPDQWKQTFKAVGISKKDLQNPETAKVIYETLSQFNEPLSPPPPSTDSGFSEPLSDAPPMDAPPMDAPPMDAPPMDAPPLDAPPMDAPPMETSTPSVDKRPPTSAPPPDTGSSGGGHDNLLASIRQGTKLRSVPTAQPSAPNESKHSSSSALPDLSRMTSTQTNTVMSALQKAMLERGKAIQVEDDDDGGGDKDDWDD